MLQIRNLEKSFPDGIFKRKKILQNVSFDLIPNRITGFLGPNGAGKTTTIKIIMGLLKADGGKIEIEGKEIDNEGRRKIGYLPETPSFYPYLTAREFLYIVGRIEGLEKDIISRRIDEISRKLFFNEFLDKRINTLSKGTVQKVAFAQALIGEPELIILDEPFSGLDPIVMSEIRDFIFSLRDANKTILISSHMLLEMERICENIVLINQGKIVLSGNISDLKKKWRIKKAIENDKELCSKLLKDEKIEDFLKKIIRDDNEIWRLDIKALESSLSEIREPTLENIFLEAVKIAKLSEG